MHNEVTVVDRRITRIAKSVSTLSTYIVVPCYNEEQRLNVQAFYNFLMKNEVNFVFVNDGSSDDTLTLLNGLRDRAPHRISVVDLAQNSGKAEAVRKGLLAAMDLGAEFVGYWDADLATPLNAIPDFVRVMNKFDEVQVVYGARRMMLGRRIQRTIGRRFVSRVCATLARQAVRLPIGDTQCGAKLLRATPALRAALNEKFTAGWLFDVELFTRLSTRMSDRRFAFYEQPLDEWDEVEGSKVSTRAIVRSGFQMLRLIAQSRLATGNIANTASPVLSPIRAAMPATDMMKEAA